MHWYKLNYPFIIIISQSINCCIECQLNHFTRTQTWSPTKQHLVVDSHRQQLQRQSSRKSNPPKTSNTYFCKQGEITLRIGRCRVVGIVVYVAKLRNCLGVWNSAAAASAGLATVASKPKGRWAFEWCLLVGLWCFPSYDGRFAFAQDAHHDDTQVHDTHTHTHIRRRNQNKTLWAGCVFVCRRMNPANVVAMAPET